MGTLRSKTIDGEFVWRQEELGNQVHDVIQLLADVHYSDDAAHVLNVVRVCRQALEPVLHELNSGVMERLAEELRRKDQK